MIDPIEPTVREIIAAVTHVHPDVEVRATICLAHVEFGLRSHTRSATRNVSKFSIASVPGEVAMCLTGLAGLLLEES